jgi:hypothetical protein
MQSSIDRWALWAVSDWDPATFEHKEEAEASRSSRPVDCVNEVCPFTQEEPDASSCTLLKENGKTFAFDTQALTTYVSSTDAPVNPLTQRPLPLDLVVSLAQPKTPDRPCYSFDTLDHYLELWVDAVDDIYAYYSRRVATTNNFPPFVTRMLDLIDPHVAFHASVGDPVALIVRLQRCRLRAKGRIDALLRDPLGCRPVSRVKGSSLACLFEQLKIKKSPRVDFVERRTMQTKVQAVNDICMTHWIHSASECAQRYFPPGNNKNHAANSSSDAESSLEASASLPASP